MERLRNWGYQRLRQSESLFKTDMIYLAKGNFWLLAVQISALFAGLLSSIAFANLLPKDAYGIYRYILSVSSIVGAFSLTGISTAMLHAAGKGGQEVLKNGSYLNLRWSFGVILISLILGSYYLIRDNTTLGISLYIIGAITPILGSLSLFSPFLIGKKDFRLNSFYGVIRNFLPIFFIVGGLLITNNPVWIISLYFIGHTLSALVGYLGTLKKYPPNQTAESPKLARYSKHLSVIGVLNTLAEHADKIIIFQFVGAAELAVYAFATSLPLQIKGILKNIPQLAFPKYTDKQFIDLKQDIPKKMITFSLGIVPIVLLYIISAPLIFEVLFPQYLGSIKMSQIFSISLIFYSGSIITTAFQAHEKIRELYYTNIFSTIAKLVSLGVLAYLFGVWGIVYARIVYELLSTTILFRALKKA